MYFIVKKIKRLQRKEKKKSDLPFSRSKKISSSLKFLHPKRHEEGEFNSNYKLLRQNLHIILVRSFENSIENYLDEKSTRGPESNLSHITQGSTQTFSRFLFQLAFVVMIFSSILLFHIIFFFVVFIRLPLTVPFLFRPRQILHPDFFFSHFLITKGRDNIKKCTHIFPHFPVHHDEEGKKWLDGVFFLKK